MWWWPEVIYVITHKFTPGIILGMGSANERRRYIVTSSLIGWAHTQNDNCATYWNEPPAAAL